MKPWVPTTFAVLLVLSGFIEEGADAVVWLGPAVTGLVTGTVGTVLAAIALGAQVAGILAKKEEAEKMKMMMMMMDETRRKRDAEDPKEKMRKEKAKLEALVDQSYSNDQSQCVEMLVCSLTGKFIAGKEISPLEEGILKWIEQDISGGATYKRMLVAQKVAAGGGDCEFLFDSCHLETSKMLEFMNQTIKSTFNVQKADNKA